MAGGRPLGLSPAIHVLGRPMAVPGPFFFLNRRRRPSADALVRMAGDRSGSLTGSARQAPSLGPLFRARPWRALRRNTKGMRAPIGPLRSGFRPPPLAPAKGGPLATDRLCSGASPAACGVTSGQRRFPSLPAWLGLTPPVPARRSAAVPAPHRLRTGLRPGSGSSGSLGPTAHPWAAPCGPAARPTRHCGFASGPSAPRRSGSPQDGPARVLPSLVPRSVGRLGGLRAPLLPPGAWSGPAGRFFTAPAPGDGSRCSQGLASGFWLAQAGRLPPALCQLCQLILLASTGNLFVSYNGNG